MMLKMSNAGRPKGAFVSVGSAALHVQMEELFGLPKVTRVHDDELFGPYVVGEERRFWRYSLDDDAWTVLTCPTQPRSLIMPVEDESWDGLLEAFGAVRACPPAGLPSNIDERIAGEPFVFEGWRFFWVFYPELARWELAPAGRA